MSKNQRDPSLWLDQINKNKQEPDYDRKKAIICDLDGTLAFPTDRSFYEEEKCITDLPNLPVVKAITLFANAGYQILFTSGRQEKSRDATYNWLLKYVVCDFKDFYKNKDPNDRLNLIRNIQLFMRRDGDMRPDTVVKKEIYDNEIKDFNYVEAVFDDRPSVCRTWWELGLFVFKCHQSDKEF
jgi:hypothetical protein